MSSIHVCQAGSCRRAGSEAVLVEIEELASAIDDQCDVRRSGCLGLCSRAPAAVIVEESGEEIVHTRIQSLEESANVVTSATGRKSPLEDPAIQARLAGVRAMRLREHAIKTFRWNGALKAVGDEIVSKRSKDGRKARVGHLVSQAKELIKKAGYDGPASDSMPTTIEAYSQWDLERITKVSKHSAVFHFKSNDRKRGTPNPRGRGRAPPQPKTWHTTLLGEVGKNKEGPLPWVERDYTPISSSLEWERGTCDILIKIYNDGAATSWLHRALMEWETRPEPGLKVWMSKPLPTLNVPYLISGANSFNPASVLLLLAGTGVVALPQILHHRDPYGKIGISTRKQHQLHVPVDLMLSCRLDDVLMVPEIMQYCQEACDFAAASPDAEVTKGVRRCTLLVTNAQPSPNPPFPTFNEPPSLSAFQSMPNARVVNSRLSMELVKEALSRMSDPCRIVVSGPSGFNAAAKKMLLLCNVGDNAITILEA